MNESATQTVSQPEPPVSPAGKCYRYDDRTESRAAFIAVVEGDSKKCVVVMRDSYGPKIEFDYLVNLSSAVEIPRAEFLAAFHARIDEMRKAVGDVAEVDENGLLPCRCGSKAIDARFDNAPLSHAVECRFCSMRTGWHQTREEAHATWNRRTPAIPYAAKGEPYPYCSTPHDPKWAAVAERVKNAVALAKFKSYVHGRLDAAGVPTDPDSPHKAEGCRIGGRLDLVLDAWHTRATPSRDAVAEAAIEAVSHLPKTADGVIVVPGMLAFRDAGERVWAHQINSSTIFDSTGNAHCAEWCYAKLSNCIAAAEYRAAVAGKAEEKRVENESDTAPTAESISVQKTESNHPQCQPKIESDQKATEEMNPQWRKTSDVIGETGAQDEAARAAEEFVKAECGNALFAFPGLANFLVPISRDREHFVRHVRQYIAALLRSFTTKAAQRAQEKDQKKIGELMKAAREARDLIDNMHARWPGTMSIDAKRVDELLRGAEALAARGGK